MIIGRQTQLHKLHTGIYPCVFGHPCVFVRAAALVKMLIVHCACVNAVIAACVEMGFLTSFSFHFTFYLAVILPFRRSDLLSPTPHVPVV